MDVKAQNKAGKDILWLLNSLEERPSPFGGGQEELQNIKCIAEELSKEDNLIYFQGQFFFDCMVDMVELTKAVSSRVSTFVSECKGEGNRDLYWTRDHLIHLQDDIKRLISQVKTKIKTLEKGDG